MERQSRYWTRLGPAWLLFGLWGVPRVGEVGGSEGVLNGVEGISGEYGTE